MNPVVLAYMPIFGLAIGSFLNLNIDRIPRGLSIVSPPSLCDRCQRRLGLLDLVPLLSYLWLRGRCRFCGVPIPLRAFLVEAVTGALFGFVAYRFGLTPLAGVILAYGSLLITVSVIDLEHIIIPDKLVIPGILLAFAAVPFGPIGEDRALGEAFWRAVAGGGLGMAILLFIYVMAFVMYRSNIGFGFGDVKLGALIGLVIGFPDVLIALYFTFISGGVTAVLLLLLRLRGRRDAIPYGPFLAVGAIATLLVDEGIGWYLDFIRWDVGL